MQLNHEQLTALETREGAFSCIAVPGAGKTEVFVRRAVAVKKELKDQSKFLALTFSNEGAKEMAERAGFTRKPNEPVSFRTFHSWGLEFVKTERCRFPFRLESYPVLLPFDQYKMLYRVIGSLGVKAKVKEVIGFISLMKRGNVSPHEAHMKAKTDLEEDYSAIYARYEESCRERGLLDFDSILLESVRLLEKNEDIREKWRLDFLQVDEAQDTDEVQWKLVELLSGKRNIFAVGDPNQCVYQWRGSNPEGMTTEFIQRFPHGKIIPLGMNYRSTGKIVAYCKSIAPMLTVGVETMRTDNPEGVDPEFASYPSEIEEADDVLKRAQTAMQIAEGSKDAADYPAILARTNLQLKAFEELCGERDIKYKLLGKSGFFNKPEVKNTLAFAQYFVSPTDACVTTLLNSPFDCTRFLKKAEIIDGLKDMQNSMVGRATFAQLLPNYHHAEQQQRDSILQLGLKLRNIRQIIGGKSAENALRYIITDVGILHHYEDDEETDNIPAENVRALLRMAERRTSLLDFVHKCLKAKQAQKSPAKKLILSTIHQAKGKEWRHVFVVGVNRDVLPHKNGELEEEKRLYFVACSRAAQFLRVSCYGPPSPFIEAKVPKCPVQNELDLLKGMYEMATKAAS